MAVCSYKVLTRNFVTESVNDNKYDDELFLWNAWPIKVLNARFSEKLFTGKAKFIYWHFSAFLDNIFCEFYSIMSKVVKLTQHVQKPFTCYSNIDTHKINFLSGRIFYK